MRSSYGGDLVRVSATPRKGFDNGYGYSPDGSRVLFARFDSDDQSTLLSVKPDGTGALQLILHASRSSTSGSSIGSGRTGLPTHLE